MKGKGLIVAAVVLAIAHHDFWFWNSKALVFGFMPVGLAYHVAYTLAAAALLAFAVKYAWPANAEKFAEGDGEPPEA